MSGKELDGSEPHRILMDDLEAKKFLGVRWRQPTKEELHQIAFFEADSCRNTERHEEFSPRERDLDAVLAFDNLYNQLKKAVIVLDFKHVDIQVLHVYECAITSTVNTSIHCIYVLPSRYMIREGVIYHLDPDEDLLVI